MHSLLFFALLPLLGSATLLTSLNPNNKHLLRRQSDCSSIGEIPCGQSCIQSGYFCCPDQQGGCLTSEYCTTGDDGTPCCCPLGQVCDGSCAVTANTATVAASSPTGAATTSAPTSSSLAGSCGFLESPCGTGCMSISDKCCPDGSGSCGIDQVCQLGTNGQYGCCPLLETCDGPGYGGNTVTTSSYTSNYATYTSSSAVSAGFPSTYPDSPYTSNYATYTSSSAVSDGFPSTYPDSPSFTTPSATTAAAAATSAINGGVASEATSWSAARSWIMNLLLPLFGTVFVIR
jgi:hypothetical protein